MSNRKFEKENKKNHLKRISIVYFPKARLFTEIFSRTSSIHSGIFLGRALWADCASLRHVIDLSQWESEKN